MNPFEEKIHQLRAGEIDQIEVSRDDFFYSAKLGSSKKIKNSFAELLGLREILPTFMIQRLFKLLTF